MPKEPTTKNYICYVLSDGNRRTYCGITNNMKRRLRQHNGEISGGARSTRRSLGQWQVAAKVEGFESKSEALSFEWHMHHRKPRHRYIGSVQKRLNCILDILAHFDARFGHLDVVVH